MADENTSELVTKTEVVLEYDLFDANKKVREIKQRAVGELEVLFQDKMSLRDGRTEYFLMIRY